MSHFEVIDILEMPSQPMGVTIEELREAKAPVLLPYLRHALVVAAGEDSYEPAGLQHTLILVKTAKILFKVLPNA